MEGVVLVYKPKGPTSHDVVARIRRIAGTRRVGHAGTLDPMATGLLVVCVGRATRIVPFLVGMSKDYSGEMVLGATSDTYDAEGKIIASQTPLSPDLDMEDLRGAFRTQTGVIDQVAPPYSAVKVDGKKLYEYARENAEVPRKVRVVWVERFEPLRYVPPRVTFSARVGSGTYIRSLAHSVGEKLGCGAYLSQLCRTRVGGFSIDNAIPLEHLEADPEALADGLLSVSDALVHLPKLTLLPHAEARLRHGTPFAESDIAECHVVLPVGRPVLVLASSSGEALAVVQAETADGLYRPLCVLAGADEA